MARNLIEPTELEKIVNAFEHMVSASLPVAQMRRIVQEQLVSLRALAKPVVFIHDNSGDWGGLYVQGTLKMENHSLDPDDVLTTLGIRYESHWVDMEDSRLPQKLSDVKL